MTNTSYQECEFDGCKMIGVHFEDCNPFLLSFQFNECNLSYSCFFRLSIGSTLFQSCKLHDCDFTETNLSKGRLLECDLMSSTFSRSNLEATDFRNSFNIILDPEQNKLRKAKFSKNALPGLLTKYNLIIE